MACKTIGSDKPCIFPFKYEGSTYNRCTRKDSENNRPWCATKVNKEDDNHVIDKQWGDCTDGCPGTGCKGDNFNFYFHSVMQLVKVWNVMRDTSK